MRDRRHGVAPPRPRRDRVIERDDWRYSSHSCRSSSSGVDDQHKRDWSRTPIGSSAARDWSPLPTRDEIERHRRVPASSRSETDRFVEVDSGRRREYDDEPARRDGQFRQLSEYSDSLLSRKESTFSKFQWHNLLPDNQPCSPNKFNVNGERNLGSSPVKSYYHNTNSRNFGGFSDSPHVVVPTAAAASMSMENHHQSSYLHVVDRGRTSRYGLFDSGNDGRSSSYGLFHSGGERMLQPKASIVDSIVDKIERENVPLLTDSTRQSSRRIVDKPLPLPLLKERYFDEGIFGVIRDAGVDENSNGGTDRVGYRRREVGLDHKEVQWPQEDYGLRRDDAGSDGFRRLPISYEGLYGNESISPPQEFMLQENMHIDDPSEMVLKRKHIHEPPLETVLKCEHQSKRVLSSNWDSFNDEYVEANSLLDDSELGFSHGGMAIDELVTNGISYPVKPQSYHYMPVSNTKHLRKPIKTSKRDIKRRLALPGNVKHRLGKPLKANKREIKKRLGPARSVKQRLGPAPIAENSLGPPPKVRRDLPWLKMYEQRNLENCGGSISVQDVESLENEAKKKRKKKGMEIEPAVDSEKNKQMKIEPPEDSDEFMRLVQNAFLKFVKVLNENSAKQRKYMEQGGHGPFKCTICGSSREFMDTLSLAQHAFTSCKVGVRAEHLGFHKALCVLMGWASAEIPNGTWVRQTLPTAEALSLKEDLIIWPPVLIVHNSSISENPDERMIVSIEELRAILIGMEFGQGMTNICRGKAANQSTMVVSFKSTFSGLQEAEKLHRHYSQNQHGRPEFQQIGHRISNNAETENVVADKVQRILYGYLGIASDLDKLDFETKKRCVVKSKKGIEAIADAFVGKVEPM